MVGRCRKLDENSPKILKKIGTDHWGGRFEMRLRLIWQDSFLWATG